jgi:hypothetical protein
MQVNCSFCKSPINSNSLKCEWCGSIDPVDKVSLFNKVNSAPFSANLSLQSTKEILNEPKIKSFIANINNINSLHKTSSNKGIFGALLNKIEGSNLERQKINLIDDFNLEMDDGGVELIYQKIVSEHNVFIKYNNNIENIFNATSSQELINRAIMLSWLRLLNKYQNSILNPALKNEVNQLINKY